MKRLMFALSLAISMNMFAEVKLASIFTDNMVLQQQAEVKLKGTAIPGKKVVCMPSWSNRKFTAVAGNSGEWSMAVSTPSAGGPYKIIFSDGKETVLSDILIGEVWFCSGQSNMEMPVKGFRGQPVYGSQQYIVGADPERRLRMFTVKNAWSTTPVNDRIEGKWDKASPEVVADFSATAFFFGNLLQNGIKVPVGLIQCAWSASKIEAWMPRNVLSGFTEVKLPDVNAEEFGWIAGTPTLLWNAMVNPWDGFPVKGVIWYQGEANTPAPELYRKLFPAMVRDWRRFFNNEDMPFYYVQIAPWESAGVDKTDWADFRQVQLELVDSLPNLGIAGTADAGSVKFIHPPYKIKVGERLAYWALAKTYGLKGFQYSGPVFESCALVSGNMAEVRFKYGEDGLTPENRKITGFEICGADGVFVDAEAEIINGSDKVKVWSDKVNDPVEIRYCYRNYKEGNLRNNVDLPALPFKAEIKKK